MGEGGGAYEEGCGAEEVEDDLSFFPATAVVAGGVHGSGVHEGDGEEDLGRHDGLGRTVLPEVQVVHCAVDISALGEEWTWTDDAILDRFPGQGTDDPVLKEQGNDIGDQCKGHLQWEGLGTSRSIPHSSDVPVGDIDLNANPSGQEQVLGPSSSRVHIGQGDTVESTGGPDVAVADTTLPEEKVPRKKWRKMEEKVMASVQNPPPGPFSRVDLVWTSKDNVGNGKRRETQKATIPWDRLDDFLEGEMSGRQHPCTFVEVSKQCMKNDVRKQTRAESALQEIR